MHSDVELSPAPGITSTAQRRAATVELHTKRDYELQREEFETSTQEDASAAEMEPSASACGGGSQENTIDTVLRDDVGVDGHETASDDQEVGLADSLDEDERDDPDASLLNWTACDNSDDGVGRESSVDECGRDENVLDPGAEIDVPQRDRTEAGSLRQRILYFIKRDTDLYDAVLQFQVKECPPPRYHGYSKKAHA